MPKFLNRTGLKYGRLTAICLVSRKPVIWECLCVCGKITQAKSTNLGGDKPHSTRSCGCLRDETAGARYRQRPFEWLYKIVVSRKHWIDLSYEEFLEFTDVKSCHYCGIELIWNKYRTGGKTQCQRHQRSVYLLSPNSNQSCKGRRHCREQPHGSR